MALEGGEGSKTVKVEETAVNPTEQKVLEPTNTESSFQQRNYKEFALKSEQKAEQTFSKDYSGIAIEPVKKAEQTFSKDYSGIAIEPVKEAEQTFSKDYSGIAIEPVEKAENPVTEHEKNVETAVKIEEEVNVLYENIAQLENEVAKKEELLEELREDIEQNAKPEDSGETEGDSDESDSSEGGFVKSKATLEEKPKETLEEKPKETSEEKPKETLEEKPKETSEEKPKETLEEKPKETSEEKPKETSEEKPKETLEEKPKETLEEKPKETSEEKPKETLEEKPKETLEEKPKETLEEKPKETLEEKPKETLEEKPKETLEEKPKETLEEKPKETLEEKPKETLEEKPKETLEEKPKETLEEKPKETLEEKPKETLEEKPKETLEEKPKETLEEKPKETLVEKPKETLEEKPKETSEEKPKETLEEKPKETLEEKPVDSGETEGDSDESDSSEGGFEKPKETLEEKLEEKRAEEKESILETAPDVVELPDIEKPENPEESLEHTKNIADLTQEELQQRLNLVRQEASVLFKEVKQQDRSSPIFKDSLQEYNNLKREEEILEGFLKKGVLATVGAKIAQTFSKKQKDTDAQELKTPDELEAENKDASLEKQRKEAEARLEKEHKEAEARLERERKIKEGILQKEIAELKEATKKARAENRFITNDKKEISYGDAVEEMKQVAQKSMEEMQIRPEVQQWVIADIDQKLWMQQNESEARNLGDHGIRHIYGNFQRGERFLSSKGEDMTEEKLAVLLAQVYHDTGYTIGENQLGTLKEGNSDKYHDEFSLGYWEQSQRQEMYQQVLSPELQASVATAIGKHNQDGAEAILQSVGIEGDIVTTTVHLSDKLALSQLEKSSELMLAEPKIREAVAMMNQYRNIIEIESLGYYKDGKLTEYGLAYQQQWHETFNNYLDQQNYDPDYRERLKTAVDKDLGLNAGKFSVPMEFVETPSDCLQYDPELGKNVIRVTRIEKSGEVIDPNIPLADQLGYKQIGKLCKDLGLNELEKQKALEESRFEFESDVGLVLEIETKTEDQANEEQKVQEFSEGKERGVRRNQEHLEKVHELVKIKPPQDFNYDEYCHVILLLNDASNAINQREFRHMSPAERAFAVSEALRHYTLSETNLLLTDKQKQKKRRMR